MKWEELMGKLEQRKFTLDGFSNLMAMLREIESIHEELKEVEVSVEIRCIMGSLLWIWKSEQAVWII